MSKEKNGPKGYVIALGKFESRIYAGEDLATKKSVFEDFESPIDEMLVGWLFPRNATPAWNDGLLKRLDIRDRIRNAKGKEITLTEDEYETLKTALESITGLREEQAVYIRELMNLEPVTLKA